MEVDRKRNVLMALSHGDSYVEKPDEHVDPGILFLDSAVEVRHNWCQGNTLGQEVELVDLQYDGVADVDAISIAQE